MSKPAGDTTVATPEPMPASGRPAPGTGAPTPAAGTPANPPDRVKRFHKPKPRQARVTIRKVGPWSVLKLSLLFYICVMAVIVGALVILYGFLGAIGALDSTERLIRDLFADQSFQIHGSWLFSRAVTIGFAMAVLFTLINVFVAFLYNLLSDIVGGIEVTLSERR